MRPLVVIPTYDESENIERMLRRIRECLPQAGVLVVDDGSPDGTAELVQKVAAELPDVHLLSRTAKSGLGSAYRAGFAWGLERGYDAFVEIDADFSHDPAALPSLVAPLEDGFDVSIGSRYVEGGSIPNWAWHRHLLSRGGNIYASAVLGLGVADSTAGYRAYSADILRRLDLDRIRAEGYGFQIEMTYRAKQHGAAITEVPISFVDREAGESKMSSVIVVEALALVTWWGLGRLLRARAGDRAAAEVRWHGARGRGRDHRGPAARARPAEAGRATPAGPSPTPIAPPRIPSARHDRARGRCVDVTIEAPPARILVVDDEPNIAELLSAALSFEGYQVGVASTGAEALEQVRTFRPHLVMLDVMLPDFDGNEVCRRMRNQGELMPVVFLTARDTTQDKVEGLSMGDDYVTKPFSIEELMARVGAILRRVGEVAAGDISVLQFADLVMNVDTHEVWRDEQPVDLTATEFNLLRYLLENARRVISKSELLDNVWGFDFRGDPNIVETYISYLRKKIDVTEPALIHTIRRVGYTLRLPREG